MSEKLNRYLFTPPLNSAISNDYYEERSWEASGLDNINYISGEMLEYHEIQQIMLDQDIGWEQAKFLYDLRKQVEAGMDTSSLFWDIDGRFGSLEQNAPPASLAPDTSWKHPASSQREHSIRSPRGQFRNAFLQGLKQGTIFIREE